jgi:hypothetical protein
MTNVTVNNRPLECNLSENYTVTDVINIIQADIKGKEVLTSMTIDGEHFQCDSEHEVFRRNITNYGHIDFFFQRPIDLAYEALDSTGAYIDIISAKIQDLLLLYNENKPEAANAKFAEVIDIMDLFIQLMSKINRTIREDLNDKYVKSPTIQNLEIHLLSVLKALIPAKEKDDVIMLCDLLEYELIDNLTQWKIKAIPELKRLKTN